MNQRVPDEYFRPNAESDDVSAGPRRRRAVDPSGVRSVPAARVRDGITARALVITVVLLLATSFGIGRLFVFPAEPPAPAPVSPSVSEPLAAASPDPIAPYDGPTVTVAAHAADGDCHSGREVDPASSLVDQDQSTKWTCTGNGVEALVVFTFEEPVTLVGVRLINGNTVDDDRYLEERRILSIRWTFSDGSFFDQGLAASNRGLQEVRFPRIEATSAQLQVLDSTRPGGSTTGSNQISISAIEFLGPG